MHSMSTQLLAIMIKNYAGRKYAPGLVLIFGVRCAASFAGVVGAPVCRVAVLAAVPAGVRCVSVVPAFTVLVLVRCSSCWYLLWRRCGVGCVRRALHWHSLWV